MRRQYEKFIEFIIIIEFIEKMKGGRGKAKGARPTCWDPRRLEDRKMRG